MSCGSTTGEWKLHQLGAHRNISVGAVYVLFCVQCGRPMKGLATLGEPPTGTDEIEEHDEWN